MSGVVSTALAVLAVFVGAWLGIATLTEQGEEIAALKREVGRHTFGAARGVPWTRAHYAY